MPLPPPLLRHSAPCPSLVCSPPHYDALLPSAPRRSARRHGHLFRVGCGEMSTPGARRNNTSTSASIAATAATPGQLTLGHGVRAAAATTGLKRGVQSITLPRLTGSHGLPSQIELLRRAGAPPRGWGRRRRLAEDLRARVLCREPRLRASSAAALQPAPRSSAGRGSAMVLESTTAGLESTAAEDDSVAVILDSVAAKLDLMVL